jgi:type I restriction enzyme M protein
MSNFHDVPALSDAIHLYCDTAFAWHKRQATLNHDSQIERSVHEDYTIWTLLVKETMLGGRDEEQRRDEFALQAVYVVFIRYWRYSRDGRIY